MASTGKEKWIKYFSKGSVETVLATKTGTVPVLDLLGKNKTDNLPDGYSITVPQTSSYDSKYLIKYIKNGKEKLGKVSELFVAKPIEQKQKKSNITASAFINKGQKRKIDYADQEVEVMSFKTSKDIINSIVYGLQKRPDIDPALKEFLIDFVKSPKPLAWPKNIPELEIKNFGVYLGELLIGIYVLDKKWNSFSKKFITEPVKYFNIPISSNFSGVDSIFETGTGYVPVSSKFGMGAKASIFSNIIPKGLKIYNQLKPSVFKDILEIIKKYGVSNPEKNGKEIVYLYGIHNLLKLRKGSGKKDIKDALSIYTSIRQNDLTEDVVTVIKEISEFEGLDIQIKNKLPNSVTSFFCRMLAVQLNKDKTAIDQMKKILAGKNFWQANLNISKWLKGEVYFKMLDSGDIDLKIIGSKSAIDDITAKQGLINYEMKYRE